MRWKFRPYDNGLDYTLKDVRFFDYEGSMFNHIVHRYAEPLVDEDGEYIRDEKQKIVYEYPFTSRDLYISRNHFDDSYINWPRTHYIMTTKWDGYPLEEPIVVGMCCPLDPSIASRFKDLFFEFCRLLDYPPDIRREIDTKRRKEYLNYERLNTKN